MRLTLWSASIEQGYSAPIWLIFKQAQELGAHIRKGEQGTMVVYADKVIRTETDAETGKEAERADRIFGMYRLRGRPRMASGQISLTPTGYTFG